MEGGVGVSQSNHIGEKLKKGRIAKGYTLDYLQQVTKIQKRYLIAIEENKFEELPGDFFIKTFIRQYADIVDVDLNEDNLNFYNLDSSLEPPVKETNTDDKERLTRSQVRKNTKGLAFTYNSEAKATLATLLVLLLFILILGMIWFYGFYNRDNSIQPNQSIINQTQTVPSQEGTDSEEAAADTGITQINQTGFDLEAPVYSVTQLEFPSTLVLDINPTGDSWVRVDIGDETLFEGTISAGSQEEIELDNNIEEIVISVGYLPSTSITIGDEQVNLPDNIETTESRVLTFQIE